MNALPQPAAQHLVARVASPEGQPCVVEYQYWRGSHGTRWDPPDPPELYVTRVWCEAQQRWAGVPPGEEEGDGPWSQHITGQLWDVLNAEEDARLLAGMIPV